MLFKKILDESTRKSNKIWVDKASEFYNRSMKSCLEKNAIEMHSIQIKNKTYQYMTPISKNKYVDKLDDIVNKFNNAYHRTIKMNTDDVKPSMYIVFN